MTLSKTNLSKTNKRIQASKRIAAAALFSLGSSAAIGEGLHDGSGFTITPSVGHHTHDSDKLNLRNSNTLSLGAGYQFASPWAAELTYLVSKPKYDGSSVEADEEHLRLDALYYMSRMQKTQVYSVMGAGISELSGNGGKTDDMIVNAGLGIKYAFNDVVALRSDLRLIHHFDTPVRSNQAAFNIGLSFLLGGKPAAKPIKNTDSDRDGVIDRLDSCPGTASSVPVDANGCPAFIDADKDGVSDAKDNCPDTKAGAKVDANGCYIVLTEDRKVNLKLQFANNAATVLNPNDPQIIALAKFMREYPKSQVLIKGYTDSRGSERYNQQLSEKRAKAVGVLLTENGINASRVEAQGLGEASPIADNRTEEGRAQNRRVEAVVSATVDVIQSK